MRKGDSTEQTKNGKKKGRNKCKGNRSELTIWAEVIYQNDLLDETGRGAVQNTAGTQERKSHFVSCHNNDNVRTDRNLLCYALQQEYQTPVKWKWWPCSCNSVHWQAQTTSENIPESYGISAKPYRNPQIGADCGTCLGQLAKDAAACSAPKQKWNGENHLPRGSPIVIPICQPLGESYHCWRAWRAATFPSKELYLNAKGVTCLGFLTNSLLWMEVLSIFWIRVFSPVFWLLPVYLSN